MADKKKAYSEQRRLALSAAENPSSSDSVKNKAYGTLSSVYSKLPGNRGTNARTDQEDREFSDVSDTAKARRSKEFGENFNSLLGATPKAKFPTPKPGN